MIEDLIKIRDLIGKLQKDTITEDENAELEGWRSANSENEARFAELMNPYHIQQALKSRYQHHANTEEALQKIIGSQRKKATIIGLGWLKIAAAAAVIFIAVLSIFFYNRYSAKNQLARQKNQHPATLPDRPPGGNYATLKLADGTVIPLDKAAAGQLAQQGGTAIIKQKDGSITYLPGKSSGTISLNTLETPPGGQYPLTLSDGTKVFVNSVSQLEYPTDFTGKNRTVRLSGEAYFEVVKDSLRPFHVIVNGMDIRVTGTKFSVNNYHDEPFATATLVEGGIKVTPAPIGPNISTTTLSIDVRPGQAAKYDPQTGMVKLERNVDVQAAIAYVNGRFVMSSADLTVMLRQMARWYGVQIKFENGIPNAVISGTIDKNLNLFQAIEVLNELGIKARFENNKLIVTK